MGYLDEHRIITKTDGNLMDIIRHYCPGIEFTKTGKVFQAKCPFFSEEETRFMYGQLNGVGYAMEG